MTAPGHLGLPCRQGASAPVRTEIGHRWQAAALHRPPVRWIRRNDMRNSTASGVAGGQKRHRNRR